MECFCAGLGRPRGLRAQVLKLASFLGPGLVLLTPVSYFLLPDSQVWHFWLPLQSYRCTHRKQSLNLEYFRCSLNGRRNVKWTKSEYLMCSCWTLCLPFVLADFPKFDHYLYAYCIISDSARLTYNPILKASPQILKSNLCCCCFCPEGGMFLFNNYEALEHYKE